jgi:site-specific recombinase XerD
MKLEKAIEVYLHWKETHTTVASNRYKVRLKHFKDYFVEEKSIESISGDDIVSFHNHLKSSGYSLTTVAYSGRILKNFFEFWKGRNISSLNPKEIISTKFISKERYVVTKEDFEDLCDTLDERYVDDLMKKLILHLLWDTGMRVSELVDLNLSDLLPTNKLGLRSARIRSRKTMRYNLVMWGKETNRLLNEYLAVRLDNTTESKALFIHLSKKDPKRITTRAVQRWVKEIADMAMIDKHISPHSFRHGKAHHMLDNGANIRDVQAILRHMNPQSSFHYMTLNETKFMEIAARYVQ